MIIACRECNGKVSTSATRCPHCGVPMAQREDSLREPEAMDYSPQHPEGASMIFVLGLLGLLLCGPLGTIAWIQARSYEAKCAAMGLKPESMAVTGKVLGIIVTILMLIIISLLVVAIALPLLAGALR